MGPSSVHYLSRLEPQEMLCSSKIRMSRCKQCNVKVKGTKCTCTHRNNKNLS